MQILFEFSVFLVSQILPWNTPSPSAYVPNKIKKMTPWLNKPLFKWFICAHAMKIIEWEDTYGLSKAGKVFKKLLANDQTDLDAVLKIHHMALAIINELDRKWRQFKKYIFKLCLNFIYFACYRFKSLN